MMRSWPNKWRWWWKSGISLGHRPNVVLHQKLITDTFRGDHHYTLASSDNYLFLVQIHIKPQTLISISIVEKCTVWYWVCWVGGGQPWHWQSTDYFCELFWFYVSVWTVLFWSPPCFLSTFLFSAQFNQLGICSTRLSAARLIEVKIHLAGWAFQYSEKLLGGDNIYHHLVPGCHHACLSSSVWGGCYKGRWDGGRSWFWLSALPTLSLCCLYYSCAEYFNPNACSGLCCNTYSAVGQCFWHLT